MSSARVDAVICTYNEDIEKVNLTLQSCLNQTITFQNIFLVDDASTIRFDIEKLIDSPLIKFIQLTKNKGISGARNSAIALSKADFIACINIDVVLDESWLQKGLAFLQNENNAGCVFGRIMPYKNTLLSIWRMRFHEVQFDQLAPVTHFAPGHAVLFKKKAIEKVGGYNESLRLIREDSDICERMKDQGFDTCYLSTMFAISYQDDDLELLAKKHIVRIGGDNVHRFNYNTFLSTFTKDVLTRIGRNIFKGRFNLISIDIKIYFKGFKYYKRKRELLRQL